MHLGEPVIDCDIHATVPSVEALFPYLSEHWREYIRTSAFNKGPTDTAYPPHAPTTVMPAAVNDWLVAEWLDKEPRLRASVVVPTRVPDMAAREIDRLGDHPGFV